MSNKFKKWTDEEIQFLKFAYPNKDFTMKEICDALNRSASSIHSKCNLLGVMRYKESVPEGYKVCTKCDTLLSLSHFSKRGDNKNLYRSWCRYCRSSEHKYYVDRMKTTNDVPTNDVPTNDVPTNDVPTNKICRDCGSLKGCNEFYKNKNSKDGLNTYCKECSKRRREESVLKKLKERGW